MLFRTIKFGNPSVTDVLIVEVTVRKNENLDIQTTKPETSLETIISKLSEKYEEDILVWLSNFTRYENF